MSATDDQERQFEADFELFVEELKSILEWEKEGEMSPQSVMKIKSLLAEFWKSKS